MILGRVQTWFIRGVVISIPVVITLLILLIVLSFILNILAPVADAVAMFWADEPPDIVIQLATLASLIAFFLFVGITAEYTPGERLSNHVDRAVKTVPLISTIYSGVQQASQVLIDDTAEQFREVKLVEFPQSGSYMIGFVTGTPSRQIASAVDGDVTTTVMVPLAPNPATNGLIMHISNDRMHEVDLTVEQAMQSIMTLGMAIDGGD